MSVVSPEKEVERFHMVVLDYIFKVLPLCIQAARAVTIVRYELHNINLDELYTPVLVGGYVYKYYAKNIFKESDILSTTDLDIKIVINRPLSFFNNDEFNIRGKIVAMHIMFFRVKLLEMINQAVYNFFKIHRGDKPITKFQVLGFGNYRFDEVDKIDQLKLGGLIIEYLHVNNLYYKLALVDTSFYIQNDLVVFENSISQFDTYRNYLSKLSTDEFYKVDLTNINYIIGYNKIAYYENDLIDVKIANELFMIMDTVRMISKIEHDGELHYGEFYKYCKYVIKLIQLIYVFLGIESYEMHDVAVISYCLTIVTNQPETKNQALVKDIHTQLMNHENYANSKFKKYYLKYVNEYIPNRNMLGGGIDEGRPIGEKLDIEIENEIFKDLILGRNIKEEQNELITVMQSMIGKKKVTDKSEKKVSIARSGGKNT